MPSHTGFLTYLLGMFPALRENVQNIGTTFLGHHQIEYRGVEPIFMSAIVMMVVIALASSARRVLSRKASVVPDDTLTLRTFFEAFFGMFYDVVKGVMGAERARKYFPIIGAAAAFIFFSNLCSLIPGLNPPTSSLNVTAGCAIYILIAFNYFGLKENGWAYIAHLAGPNPYLAPLVFPIEAFSTFIVRPLTLSIRLMLNIAVDHLVGSIFLGLIAFLVPVPLMFLAMIVIVVQTLVFCLLSSIYIGLATEDMHHHH
jgi:F-type H+-transporting ATPase subunit a